MDGVLVEALESVGGKNRLCVPRTWRNSVVYDEGHLHPLCETCAGLEVLGY